jgi:hypothetical protein
MEAFGTNICKQETEAVLDASKEVGLEVKTEKTKYMVASHCQNTAQNHSLLIANKSFENMAKFRYLGAAETDQNCVQE